MSRAAQVSTLNAKRKRLVAEAALVAFVCERVARGYCPVCERYSSDAGVDHLDTCEYAAFAKALIDAISEGVSSPEDESLPDPDPTEGVLADLIADAKARGRRSR